MPSEIQLLPDALANKIAAGEVVQRPSSVVKELIENAIDAGATEIHLIIEEAGKTLIQVLDNGKGMNEQDARMAFERHATSKIKSIKDLEAIQTMGFRGEALASIASVAQVELKTKRPEDDFGTQVVIHGSKVVAVDSCSCPNGTSIAVKHLFYNVPARRKFLKKDATELKAITNEFIRASLARADIKFKFFRDGNEVFHLRAGSLRQRVAALFDKKTNEQLIPVDQDLHEMSLNGFIGRPSVHKKTRGDQYLFVNDRYIQSPYLMHGIRSAYKDLIPEGSHPFIVLFIQLDPSRVDVNVHPTKHEVKFDEERVLYNMVQVAVKHSLGKYALHPMIDFEAPSQGFFNHTPERPSTKELENWKSLYRSTEEEPKETPQTILVESQFNSEEETLFKTEQRPAFQLHKKYIVQQVKSGLLLVHQNRAHARILFEKHLQILEDGAVYCQKELFPKVVHLSAQERTIFESFAEEAKCLGFEMEKFGEDSVIIHGTPAHLTDLQMESDQLFRQLIDAFSQNIELKLSVKDNIAQSLATECAVRTGSTLNSEQMGELIDALFACENPYVSPQGKKCFFVLEHNELENLFSR